MPRACFFQSFIFRVRSPLPAAAAQRKQTIAELDRLLREWAGTARPASGRSIADRDFELAAYARTKGLANAGTSAPTAAAAAAANESDRIPAALTAAASGQATAADVVTLEETAQRFAQTGLGGMASSLVTDARRVAQQREQQQILSTTLESAKEKAGEVFSLFLVGAVEKGDAAGLAFALDIAKKHGWTLRNADPAAIRALADAAAKHTLSPRPEDRAFFELSAGELLPLARSVGTVPRVEEIARAVREGWRMKRRDASNVRVLVEKDNALGVLEQQPATAHYRFRPITNILDLATVEP